MKTIETVEMSDSQIKKGVRLFKQALKERPDLFEVEHEDPTTQNCYVSSSAYIGIYFPNSSVRLLETADGDHYKAYEVVCVSMSERGDYYLILSRDDNRLNEYVRKHFTKERLEEIYPEYTAVPLEKVTVCYEEKNIQLELGKTLSERKKELDAIDNIKFKTKVNGKPFSRIAMNFDNAYVRFEHSYDGTVSHVVIGAPLPGNFWSMENIIIWPTDEMRYKPDDFFTFEVILGLLKKRKEELRKDIAQYEMELLNLHSVFRRVMKLTKKYKEELSASVPQEFIKTLAYNRILETVKGRLMY